MALVELKTIIDADIKICFNLSRNIDFHKKSLQHSKEKAIAGKTTGPIELNEWVTWEAVHFGIKQQLTSKITEFKNPNYFVDEMVSGVFKSFKHEHIFTTEDKKTIMVDKFHFKSPLGVLGDLVNFIFLKRYMRKLLSARNQLLKQEAETIYRC